MKHSEPLTPTSGSVIPLRPVSVAGCHSPAHKLAADLMRAITGVLEAHRTCDSMSVTVTASGNNVTVMVAEGPSTTVSASSPESA